MSECIAVLKWHSVSSQVERALAGVVHLEDIHTWVPRRGYPPANFACKAGACEPRRCRHSVYDERCDHTSVSAFVLDRVRREVMFVLSPSYKFILPITPSGSHCGRA